MMKMWSSLGPYNSGTSHVAIRIDANGDVNVVPIGSHIGLNVASPTAKVHLPPGEGGAGLGPLKFTVAGTALLVTPEVGVLEPISDDLYYTISTGTARKGIVLNDGFAMVSGRVPHCTTNGRITDNYGLTFDPTNIVLGIQDFGLNAQPGLVITGYNDQPTYEPYISIRKSNSDVLGTEAETQPGDELGGLYFYGVNSTPFFAQGFHILVVQNGASGAGLVPADAYFETCTVAGLNANQMVLTTDGYVGFGTNTPGWTVDINGDLHVADKFGCNGANPQADVASGGALAAYVTGAFGLDSDAHMKAMYDLVVAIRAALVANGIMS